MKRLIWATYVATLVVSLGCSGSKDNSARDPSSAQGGRDASRMARVSTPSTARDTTAARPALKAEAAPSSLPDPRASIGHSPNTAAPATAQPRGLAAPPTPLVDGAGTPPREAASARPRSAARKASDSVDSASMPLMLGDPSGGAAPGSEPPSATPLTSAVPAETPAASARNRLFSGDALTNSAVAAVDANGIATVKVFYATNRQHVEPPPRDMRAIVDAFFIPGILALASVALLAVRCLWVRSGWLSGLAVVGIAITVGLSARTILKEPLRHYGTERGPLELGTCDVTIPPDHQVGHVEAPSIWRLEFRRDANKHFTLQNVAAVETDEFYAKLRERVGRSPRKDAFVFVHGFNVSFDTAAQRTAQIAYDLNFEGAPIFFSWPSQASLLQYAVDKENAEWAASDIKDFLRDVAERSGAEQIHLVAHSMGNRALTYALRSLAADVQRPMFNEVILTAPDIDAQIFKRDIAPAIVKTAKRVTLYASSNDEALRASEKYNGSPRAGDSGHALVVVRGVDTIDVSAVDTSLVGHSYYGSSDTVLADLLELIKKAKGPDMREFLKPHPWTDGLMYWVFEPKNVTAAVGPEATRR